jgi:hypothetical protein
VNERIATAAENYDVERAEFFFECPDPACGERVVVSLDEYERVRDESTRFVHAVEHVEPKFERVVARRARYAVVEKFGRRLTALVRRLDPRRGPTPSSDARFRRPSDAEGTKELRGRRRGRRSPR